MELHLRVLRAQIPLLSHPRCLQRLVGEIEPKRRLACEQAHLFGVSREYLGGGAANCVSEEPVEPVEPHSPRRLRRLAIRGSAAKILARNPRQVSLLAG